MIKMSNNGRSSRYKFMEEPKPDYHPYNSYITQSNRGNNFREITIPKISKIFPVKQAKPVLTKRI